MTRKIIFTLTIVALIACFPARSEALILDLTDPTTQDSGFIDDAFFQWTDVMSVGSGLFNTFAQIGDQTRDGLVVEGYNTTVNNTFDNKSSDVHNHLITLASIPIVNLDGTNYREFLLDINQEKSEGDGLLSLDEIQIFVTDNGTNQGVETLTGGILDSNGTLIYQLDAGIPDNYIKLDASLQTGGGTGDVYVYIPDLLFQVPDNDYVYLYSRLGENYNNNDGFEEWKLSSPTGECEVDCEEPVIPEPATMALFGGGLLAGAIARRKKRS